MGKLKKMQEELSRVWEGISGPSLEHWDPTYMGTSEFAGIQEDPRLRAAQFQTLGGLQDVISQGGLTATDRAKLAQIQAETGQRERGQREALMQQYAQRGLAGGGAEMAAALANQQAAAQQASMGGLEVAAQAQQARERALQQLGGFGTQVRGQEYGISAQKAQAQEAINRFNTELRNQAFLQNQAMRQQQFQNEMMMRAAKEGNLQQQMAAREAYLNRIAGAIDIGGRLLGAYSTDGEGGSSGAGLMGLIGGLSSSGAGAAAAGASDRRIKTGIVKVGEKNGLNIYNFSYKGHSGRYQGVMAQEVEEKYPYAVIEDEGIKKVFYDKIGIDFRRVA